MYDEEIPPERFDRRILDSVSRLEPFGNGNPQPLFTSRGVLVRSARVVGKDHLKLRLAEGGIRDVDAIAFKRGEMYEQVPPGCRVDVAYHLQLNEFSGVEYLEMRLRDLRPVGA